MRTLKIGLVAVFFLATLTPAISMRVAALTATLAQSKAQKEELGKTTSATQSKKDQPAHADQYVGSESCAECHAAEVAQNALTAHGKINQSNASADSRSCEACHGGAKARLYPSRCITHSVS